MPENADGDRGRLTLRVDVEGLLSCRLLRISVRGMSPSLLGK